MKNAGRLEPHGWIVSFFSLFLFFFFGCSLLASGWTGQLYSHAEGIHFTAADRLLIPRRGRTSGNAFKIHKYFVFLKPHSSESLQRRNLKYVWKGKKKWMTGFFLPSSFLSELSAWLIPTSFPPSSPTSGGSLSVAASETNRSLRFSNG